MYRRVAVVTDSTACLPAQLTDQLGVEVVQIQVRIGDHTDDESRIPVPELVSAMRANVPVVTIPPDPGAFFWTYGDLAAQGVQAVVSVHVSGRLSATVDAARVAAEQSRIPVHVVDTHTCGMSIGYAVQAAAKVAEAGGTVERVIETAQRRYDRSTELIYVDTLEYLRRGGKIGAATALVGSALSMKPLLTMADAQITPLDRVIGADRALNRMLDIAIKRAGTDTVDVAVEHFDALDKAQRLLRKLRRGVPNVRQFMLTQVSSAIGAHVGPGALGITVSPV
ncbi:DegV family protein [Nocardia sp. NRRL S-836]|uniref:DegV family protein n=1 Tax=Nocardia sp. NRRL S-836 TaxID=1519492 RepID=UPI0006AEC77B|nr:DegV family protein [Nocardia sp. NRRL S-836]KOV79826.1 DegV family protein [Nocardia sp. NRRL S-836]